MSLPIARAAGGVRDNRHYAPVAMLVSGIEIPFTHPSHHQFDLGQEIPISLDMEHLVTFPVEGG